MPLVPINILLDKTIVAKKNVYGFESDFKTIKYNFVPGSTIGKIFSWVNNPNNGDLYFMVYVTNIDYQNFNPTYIKIDDTKIKVLGLPEIIKQIEADKKAQQDAKDYADKGALRYYIEKYAPYIIGAIVFVQITPTILNLVKSGKEKK